MLRNYILGNKVIIFLFEKEDNFLFICIFNAFLTLYEKENLQNGPKNFLFH